MKKQSQHIFLLFLGICIAAVGCKKSSSGVAFTNAEVKPIFDSYCSSCHASGGKNSGDWKYDATDYDGSIKGEISKLYSTVYSRRSMPVGRSLSADELSKFKAWYDKGYPAN
jgi:mono/diheme cytochrome c family protein